ncbi:MAG: VOC family protein [Actinomycetota bacterium]
MLRDVFGFEHVDGGDGWLIFALPPAELGIHPAEGPTHDTGTRHQLTLMCEDITQTILGLRAKGVEIRGDPIDEGWGITTTMLLPGDVEVMLYEPRHPTDLEGRENSLDGSFCPQSCVVLRACSWRLRGFRYCSCRSRRRGCLRGPRGR